MAIELQRFDYRSQFFTPEQLAHRKRDQDDAKNHVSGTHCILCMVDVYGDGFGDVANCLYGKQIIQKKYPDWDIRILIYNEHSLGRFPIDVRQYGVNWEECLVVPKETPEGCISKENRIFEKKLNSPTSDFSPEEMEEIEGYCVELPVFAEKVDDFIKFFKKADLQIAISTPPWFRHPDIDRNSLKYMQMLEYGGNCMKPQPISENNLTMGLGPSSAGIYILNPIVPDEFIDPVLKELFKEKVYTENDSRTGPGLRQSPGAEIPASGSYVPNIDPLAGTRAAELSRSPGSILESFSVYFSYGSHINAYACLVHHFDPSPELNIVTNQSRIPRGDFPLMHAEGIQKIIFFGEDVLKLPAPEDLPKGVSLSKFFKEILNERGVVLSTSDIPGTTVRFFHRLRFAHSDVKVAIQESAEPVGVTGNATLSELLALGKLPFYHFPGDHAISFWNQLINLVKSATPQSKELVIYLEHMRGQKCITEPWHNRDVLQEISLSVLKKQWGELVEIIRRDWDVKDSYLGEINRRLIGLKNAEHVEKD